MSLSIMASLVMLAGPATSGVVLFMPSGALAGEITVVTGNNGTIKIHEQGTPRGTESTDPKLCTFNLEGYDFDPDQSGYVNFDVQGGDGPTGVDAGSYAVGPASGVGYFETQYFYLQPGHYKATMYGKNTGGEIDLSDVKAKSKVFKVECGKLIIKKHVINDDGGIKIASDFKMNISAQYPSMTSFPGSEAGSTVFVGAGNYWVSEVDHTGYVQSLDKNCSGIIALGDVITCTITNDDIVPEPTTGTLTVIKHVVNDDKTKDNVASDFIMNVTGRSPSTSSFAGNEDGVKVTLNPGSYSVEESDALGYTETKSAECSGSIIAGHDYTCTITNNDPAPILTGTGTIIVKKIVVNDGLGTSAPEDFRMTVTSQNPIPNSFAGSSDGVSIAVKPGSYSVEEGNHTGYRGTKSDSCTGTIDAGQTITCTITNDDEGSILGLSIAPSGTIYPSCGKVHIVLTNIVDEDGGTGYTAYVYAPGSGEADDGGYVTVQVGVNEMIELDLSYSTVSPVGPVVVYINEQDNPFLTLRSTELTCGQGEGGDVLGDTTAPSRTPDILPETGESTNGLALFLALFGGIAAYFVSRRSFAR